MNICVGIPQALLHHEFGQLWRDFFESMDIQVIVSGPTTKSILDRGTTIAIDESCLPLKVYLGHVDSLLDTCSHIFVPRVVQYYPDYYLCAKFAGLPDIVQNTFRLSHERLISPNIENRTYIAQLQNVHFICKKLGLSYLVGHKAYCNALTKWKKRSEIVANNLEKAKVAIIGHSYIIEDSFFSRDIIGPLASQGVGIVTPGDMPSKILYEEAKEFQRDIYWQLSAKIAGATKVFCRQNDVVGIILVSSFGCGPDSLINEYLEHHVLKKYGKPHMIINIDEHTGKAGLVTRVEAFWDMIERRLNI